jgi:hypothetical protein
VEERRGERTIGQTPCVRVCARACMCARDLGGGDLAVDNLLEGQLRLLRGPAPAAGFVQRWIGTIHRSIERASCCVSCTQAQDTTATPAWSCTLPRLQREGEGEGEGERERERGREREREGGREGGERETQCGCIQPHRINTQPQTQLRPLHRPKPAA